jgi:CBS domain-containing protein
MHLLMSVRLGSQLGQRAAGRTPDNLIEPGALDSVTRHQLEQALEVVGRFRRLLRQQFRLDML